MKLFKLAIVITTSIVILFFMQDEFMVSGPSRDVFSLSVFAALVWAVQDSNKIEKA